MLKENRDFLTETSLNGSLDAVRASMNESDACDWMCWCCSRVHIDISMRSLGDGRALCVSCEDCTNKPCLTYLM